MAGPLRLGRSANRGHRGSKKSGRLTKAALFVWGDQSNSPALQPDFNRMALYVLACLDQGCIVILACDDLRRASYVAIFVELVEAIGKHGETKASVFARPCYSCEVPFLTFVKFGRALPDKRSTVVSMLHRRNRINSAHLTSSSAKLVMRVLKQSVTATSECAFFLSSSRSIVSQPATLRVLA